ncbi:MAG: inositol monophosphatase family protein, partial [Candidatus Competibacteraceae bacterium]
RQELFTSSRGAGATVDGRKMRVSDTRLMEKSLIGTGYPYRQDPAGLDAYLGMLKDAMLATAGVRRPGAAALDLAYVAAGRLDGFWETGLKIWDVAAGALMIQECGGIITDLAGGEGWQQSGNVLAGNPKIHEALQKLIEPHLTQDLRS